MADPMLLAKGDSELFLLPQMANRHGLIAGATGTGKTVTLQVLAEHFSSQGVPVFMSDVKGDLSGISQPGATHPKILARAQQLGLTGYGPDSYPVALWDVFGEKGHPVRATVTEMGPLLLGRLLNLNDVQNGVLNIVFKVADDNGFLLLDFKDLRSMIQHVGENAAEFSGTYGNIAAASIGAIQRNLLALEQQGAASFFAEPALDLEDFMQTDEKGRGVINILAADKLMMSPKIYATFLLWLLSELFERLPEAGDLPKPKLVFFFDEAHLLFDDMPPALMDKVEQVVRLIRSKGVGVFFVTQNPRDIPETVLGQLGNRVQHALRAFTPTEQKAVKSAANSFRQNPKFSTETAITELGVGEALVSLLDEKGQPCVVERAFVCPPRAQVGPITDAQRAAIIDASILKTTYSQVVDRESAYEKLKTGVVAKAHDIEGNPVNEETGGLMGKASEILFGREGGPGKGRSKSGLVEQIAKSAMRSATSRIGTQIMRGIMGGIFGGTKRR